MVKVLSVNGKIPLVDGKAISATGGGSTVELDTTLSKAGKAADAKAVGDALAGKQDAISDLETIRSGAANGATAVQPEAGKGLFSGNYNDLTNKPTIPSVPKPLTYDYMPEGYPTKSMQTTTLMEEQELAFALMEGAIYVAALTNAFNIVVGQTYTVNWDGTEYECVCYASDSIPALGNLSILGGSDDTGEPFLYSSNEMLFATFDTSASHTISVKKIVETVIPMAEEFLPNIPADKLPADGATTLHINVTAVNPETMEAIFTADKTPVEMEQAACTGPVWCVVSFAADIVSEGAVSIGVPPAWRGGEAAFGERVARVHDGSGKNTYGWAVRRKTPDLWIVDKTQFVGESHDPT